MNDSDGSPDPLDHSGSIDEAAIRAVISEVLADYSILVGQHLSDSWVDAVLTGMVEMSYRPDVPPYEQCGYLVALVSQYDVRTAEGSRPQLPESYTRRDWLLNNAVAVECGLGYLSLLVPDQRDPARKRQSSVDVPLYFTRANEILSEYPYFESIDNWGRSPELAKKIAIIFRAFDVRYYETPLGQTVNLDDLANTDDTPQHAEPIAHIDGASQPTTDGFGTNKDVVDSLPEPTPVPNPDGTAARLRRFLDTTTEGTVVRVFFGAISPIALAALLFGYFVWPGPPSNGGTDRIDAGPVVTSALLTPPTPTQDLTPPEVNLRATIRIYRNSTETEYRYPSGLYPGPPFVAEPGELLFVDVVLEKRVGTLGVPADLSLAISHSSDLVPNLDSFRLYNAMNEKTGTPVPAVTREFKSTPVTLNNGGGGVTYNFSISAPAASALSCNYNNVRTLTAYFKGGDRQVSAQAPIYVRNDCVK